MAVKKNYKWVAHIVWFLIVWALWVNLSHAAVWNLRDVRWSGSTDSVRLTQYRDQGIVGTALRTGVQSWDTVLTAADGYDNKAVFKVYFTGQSYAAPWTFEWNLKAPTTGSYTLYFPIAVADSCDSIRLKVYEDTTLVGSDLATAVRDFDTTIDVRAGYMTTVVALINWASDDSSTAWYWTVDWHDTTSAGVATPTDPNRCMLTGYVRDNNGGYVEGAIITAVRTSGENATVDAGGVNVIVTGLPVVTATDANGYFSMYLIGTHEFQDTTRAFYNISASYGKKDIWSLKKVWMPSSGVFNVGDTLSSRTQ